MYSYWFINYNKCAILSQAINRANCVGTESYDNMGIPILLPNFPKNLKVFPSNLLIKIYIYVSH